MEQKATNICSLIHRSRYEQATHADDTVRTQYKDDSFSESVLHELPRLAKRMDIHTTDIGNMMFLILYSPNKQVRSLVQETYDSIVASIKHGDIH